ncbi:hypothetical protein SAMN04515674_101470 [Pseudarcicella hirudinis]|uniref:Uncharacterized protein n=1 Tax=Pseudarcicella hirudinis TaxID=1079859 RepID=A0A1I5MVK9_9BACT|nr:hypothetical protein [Pseudarcicella hirudinis]SFP13625.1 hypothetical protein SAMN04515674_101470 [Pseudarcicella hirudinis]
MARTRNEIFTSITNKTLELLPSLENTTTTGNVRLWDVIKGIAAEIILQVEINWDRMRTQVQAYVDNTQVMTIGWYADRAKKFQISDTLTWTDFVPKYPQIDTTKQIIKYVSVQEDNNGFLYVRVAKADNAGNAVSLTPTELAEFSYYFRSIKPAGVKVLIDNATADTIKLEIEITRSTAGGNLTTGLNSDYGITVRDAITDFFKLTQFNGYLSLRELSNYIKDKAFLIDCDIKNAYWKDGATWTVFTTGRQTTKGFFVLDIPSSTVIWK